LRFLVRGLKARFAIRLQFEIIRRHVRPGDIVCDIGPQGQFVW
jgi:hypothetical protein